MIQSETIQVFIPGKGIVDLPNTPEGRMRAVKVDPMNIQFLSDPTEAEQRAACEGSSYYAIKLIKNPTLDLQKEAVQQDPALIRYAPDLRDA